MKYSIPPRKMCHSQEGPDSDLTLAAPSRSRGLSSIIIPTSNSECLKPRQLFSIFIFSPGLHAKLAGAEVNSTT